MVLDKQSVVQYNEELFSNLSRGTFNILQFHRFWIYLSMAI